MRRPLRLTKGKVPSAGHLYVRLRPSADCMSAEYQSIVLTSRNGGFKDGSVCCLLWLLQRANACHWHGATRCYDERVGLVRCTGTCREPYYTGHDEEAAQAGTSAAGAVDLAPKGLVLAE